MLKLIFLSCVDTKGQSVFFFLLTKQSNYKVNSKKQDMCYSSCKRNVDVTAYSFHPSILALSTVIIAVYTPLVALSLLHVAYKPFANSQNKRVCKKNICGCHLKISFSLVPRVELITGYINASFTMTA